MKVVVDFTFFADQFAMSMEDSGEFMKIIGRSAVVQREYVNGKGFRYEYKPMTNGLTFTVTTEDKLIYPADLATLVQVTREQQAGRAEGVIPDAGVNTEASRTDEGPF